MKIFTAAVAGWLYFCNSGIALERPNEVVIKLKFSHMAGVTDILDPKQRNLSPIYPMAMLESGGLMRFLFCGPYGLKDTLEPYSQLKGTETDNPLSYTALLLQYLFPSPDGVNFISNQRKFFVLNGMSASLLGALFKKVNQGDSLKEIDEFLRAAVSKTCRPEVSKIVPVLQNAFDEDFRGVNFYSSMARHIYMAYVLRQLKTKDELWDFLESADLLLPAISENVAIKERFLASNFTENNYKIFKSHMDKLVIPVDEIAYQAKFVQVFRGYQQERLDSGIDTIYKRGEKVTTLPSVESIMEPVQQYEQLRPTSTQLTELINSPELMLLMGAASKHYERIDLNISYGTAKLWDGERSYSFSDCAESVLFSLCNALLYDADKNCLDLIRLPPSTRPEFKEFFFRTVGHQHQLGQFRSEWSKLLCNLDTDEIAYLQHKDQQRYELVPDNTNLLAALEYILGLVPETEDEVERWQSLLSLFNTDKKKLTLTDLEAYSSSGPLEIDLNDSSYATLESDGDHSSFQLHKRYTSWTHPAAREMLFKMVNNQVQAEDFLILSV